MTAPEVRITVSLEGVLSDITLSYPLDPEHEALLAALHENGNKPGQITCRMHDNDPRLRDLRSTDGRIHDAWLLIRKPKTGRMILAHWPNTGITGRHTVPSRMTPEHLGRQEYIALRSEACGWGVELEKRLPNGFRPDVVITGDVEVAAEVQLSDITVAQVKRRTAKAAEFGLTSTWFAGSKGPVWAFKAPHVETNKRIGLEPRSWTISTGPRFLEHERCMTGSRVECPNGPNWCDGWHMLWSPIPGLTVDDIVEQVPAAALVRLDTGTRQGVILTRPADKETWLAERSPTPPARPPRVNKPDGPRHADNYSASSLRRRIEASRSGVDVDTPERPRIEIRATPKTVIRYCATCPFPIWVEDPRRMQCQACIDAGKPLPVWQCARCGYLTVANSEWVCSICGDAIKAGA